MIVLASILMCCAVIARAACGSIRAPGAENFQALIMRHKPRHVSQFENHAPRANNADNQQRLEVPLRLLHRTYLVATRKLRGTKAVRIDYRKAIKYCLASW